MSSNSIPTKIAPQNATKVAALSERLVANVEKVILGKREQIRLACIALLCEGHVLLEDVPGVGKTVLSRSLAKSLGCTFSRIQCTPDLLPGDLLGVSIYNQKTLDFEFHPGPVFCQVLLADEVNRATPKTQSALLECMEERQVTISGNSYQLKRPFLVLATQNPVDYEGTFPLPEAQLDRFLMRLTMGYPSAERESTMLLEHQNAHPLDSTEQVVSVEELLEAQRLVTQVRVDESLRNYVVAIVNETRHHSLVSLGASPRGSRALYKAAQAGAAVNGRDFVTPDDIRELAVPTLAHRLILNRRGHSQEQSSQIIRDILGTVPVPV